MGTTLTNSSGSGKVQDDSLISFSYSEDVTSLEPSNLTGGVGQVSITAVAVHDEKVGNTHPASKFLINNQMVLTDDNLGTISFNVKEVSISDEVVSASGLTIHERLNVTRTAAPHGGSGATLWTAIVYYCSLVDVVPSISSALQATLDAIDVNFIGWQGNVWEHLKMLCAGVTIADDDNVGLEMYIDDDTLTFRQALTTNVVADENIVNASLSINSADSSQSFDVIRYITEYKTNGIVKEEDRQELTGKTQAVTISDSMQVDAGETLIKRFKIDASLESVNQPTAVSAISTLPYTDGGYGEYVIVGNDDLPVLPSQWESEGGSLTVALTENPNEIEITIVAPPAPSLTLADDPAELTYAPYKVGVESSGGTEYPALYITGTGVFFETKTKTFLTGASNDYTADEKSAEVDNPFITKDIDQASRGLAAAQANCGPDIQLSMTLADGLQFGGSIGSVITYGTNKYRITSISFSDDVPSITAKGCASFSDFEDIWSGLDFNDFTSVALDPSVAPDDAMKFNEFSVTPLMESA